VATSHSQNPNILNALLSGEKITTILGALKVGGLEAAMTIEGAADSRVFEVFVEHYLSPTLKPGQKVVMDNLSIHKGHKIRELIESAGCELVFLPTYSPDLNPSELAWSKLKQGLRRAQARTRQALEAVIGAGLDLITSSDAQHWFQHCGYHFT
jgi:transposase